MMRANGIARSEVSSGRHPQSWTSSHAQVAVIVLSDGVCPNSLEHTEPTPGELTLHTAARTGQRKARRKTAAQSSAACPV